RWKALWPGKQAFNAAGDPDIHVIKGNVDASNPNAAHQVDGLAGATLTSKGVQHLLDFWLGQQGFGPFLANLRQSAVQALPAAQAAPAPQPEAAPDVQAQAQPEVVQQPEAVQPEVVQPEAIQPEAVQPEAVPEAVQPEVVQPEAQPEAVQPQPKQESEEI
ncbi:MAG: FMN-binding protein, partial [Rhodocyclaceae bacterium]|nr:FMN-binding protein [Rhodocyclaceae bacterium]